MFLVSGASGFIGHHVVQEVLGAGHHVLALVRKSSDISALRHPSISIAFYDELSAALTMPAQFTSIRHIVNCAGFSSDWGSSEQFAAGNIGTVDRLIEIARTLPAVESFTHLSTTDVYGYPDVPTIEDAPLVKTGLPYNATKIDAELRLRAAGLDQRMTVTILRPATVIGPGSQDFVLEIASLLKSRMMLLVDSGVHRAGLAYVKNLAAYIIELSETPAAGLRTLNVVDYPNVIWRDYIDKIASAIGAPSPYLDLSFSRALQCASGVERAWRFFGINRRPPITRHAISLMGKDQSYPSGRLEAALESFPKHSFESAMFETLEWLRRKII